MVKVIATMAAAHFLLSLTASGETPPQPQQNWYEAEAQYVWYFPDYWGIAEAERHPVLVECEEWEIEELVRTMYLEAGAESDECIRAVTDCTLNQLNSGFFGSTLHEVLARPGNFDETFPYIWEKGEPSERVREIVMDVLVNGIGLPSRIMFFRNRYFHDMTWAIPEFATDNVYFSSSRWVQ